MCEKAADLRNKRKRVENVILVRSIFCATIFTYELVPEEFSPSFSTGGVKNVRSFSSLGRRRKKCRHLKFVKIYTSSDRRPRQVDRRVTLKIIRKKKRTSSLEISIFFCRYSSPSSTCDSFHIQFCKCSAALSLSHSLAKASLLLLTCCRKWASLSSKMTQKVESNQF